MEDTIETVGPKSARWPKHAVWLGLVITIAGVLSYFLFFFQFPDLRDFPVLNLPVVLLGVITAAVGCWQVFRQNGGLPGKSLAAAGFVLTLGFAGLFNFYVFSMSYQVPESLQAPAAGTTAPDFTLRDHHNRDVSLSDYRDEKVVVVFYRGFW